MQQLTQGGNAPLDAPAVTVAIDWPTPGGAGLDATAYLLGASGKVRGDHDMVFYNQPSGADGAVTASPASPGSAKFEVDLARLPAAVERIVFCLTVDGTGTLSRFAGLSVAVSAKGGAPLAAFEPALGSASEAALMLAELYRRGGAWKVRAVAQGFNGGLAPLARSFGIEVEEPAAPPPPPAAPPPPTPAAAPAPPPPPAAPVSLSKVSLDKARPTISLDKRGASFGEVRINLNWSRGKKGLFAGGNAIDLDVGCLWELADGRKGVVQALGRQFGGFAQPPFIEHQGDDRSGDAASGENIRINGARWDQIRRIAVFAYIYEGAANWSTTNGVLTISSEGQPPIEVRMTEGRNDRKFCGVALLENAGGSLKVTRIDEYFRDHSYYDERLGWGLRWQAGSKD